MAQHPFHCYEMPGGPCCDKPLALMAGDIGQEVKSQENENPLSHAAASLAHDLNNLLGVMATVRELLEEETRTVPRLGEYFREMAQAQVGAGELCRELVGLCSPKPTRVQPLCLVGALKKSQGVLQRILGRGIVLATELPQERLPVAVDATVFEMMLVNLAVNARDAMPQGGYWWIQLNKVSGGLVLDDGRELPPGDYVCMQVTDTGCGMAEEIRKNVFQPFYTTKPQGKGNGLGLATLSQQMGACGGAVTLTSKPGEGSTFTLWFPLLARVAEASFDVAESVNRNLSGLTVLLVEHHPTLLEMLSRQLQQRGAQMLKAGCAEEAASYLKTYTSPIDLLLCDVCLPKLGGVKVAEYALSQRPGIGVVFTSGQLPDTAVNQWLNKWGGGFVLKPFSQEELLGKIQLVLGESPVAVGLREGRIPASAPAIQTPLC